LVYLGIDITNVVPFQEWLRVKEICASYGVQVVIYEYRHLKEVDEEVYFSHRRKKPMRKGMMSKPARRSSATLSSWSGS